MSVTRIYIVEDHPIMRKMVSRVLEREDDMEVIGAAGSAEKALEELGGLAPDLLLIDLSLPGMDGIELVGELICRRPTLLCVVLSGHHEPAYIERALAAGARGYIKKGVPEELVGALRSVLEGLTYVSDHDAVG